MPYKQGYSAETLSNHIRRTAITEASFLLPYIAADSRILDIGCGPGTITTSLAAHAPLGQTIGIDISPQVLAKAQDLAFEIGLHQTGVGCVEFELGNVLDTLPFPDDSFDLVFASHVFGHFPPPDLPLRGLKEACRVLKPGGILATCDAAAQHFFPRKCGLDRLWAGNQYKVLMHGTSNPPETDLTGAQMPALMRQAGLREIQTGVSTVFQDGREARQRLAARATAQLAKGGGDAFRQSWLDAGISEEEVEETIKAANRWADMDYGWYAGLQCEILAWK